MSNDFLTPLARELPASVPFVGPEAQERARGAAFTARLGANESAFGPSPKAIAAMQHAATEAWQYADPEAHELKHALAEFHNVSTDHIMIGEGIDGLLANLVRLTITEGDHAVTSLGAYPTFNYHVVGFGGTLATVPYQDDHEDIPALWEKARQTPRTKLMYLSNPDNPMGTAHSAKVIEAAIKDIPAGVLLVLDEAYADTHHDLPQIDANTPNVIRMRTFSKAYGLAGARVGYALGAPDIIAAFNKVRNHFGMSRVGMAGALAALQDQSYLKQTVLQIEASKARIAEIARAQGLICLPSHTNFVAIDCGRDEAFAVRVMNELLERGIFVRKPAVAPQSRAIRVSCGPKDAMDAFEKAFAAAMAKLA